MVIEADDNILPLLKTEVIGSQLLISMRANTYINVTNPVHYTITMKTIESASVSGSGNMNIIGLDSDLVKFDLPGTGSITAKGNVKTLNVSLPGAGDIDCDGLKADNVVADLNGFGNITVRAGHNLNAEINGVGSINYYGDPTIITKTVTGHGSINNLP